MVDVVVVGGGVAGLQAALTLGRAVRRVVVVDDGSPRNAPARHVHNFIGIPDAAPGELLARGRSMLADYDVRLHADRVERVVGSAGRFRVHSAGGASWEARALVLATGLVDELPTVPGVAELWGREVVACPHCHGWEVRGEPLGVLGLRGMPDRAVERALLVGHWSDDVTLYTDGDELTSVQHERLAAAGIAVFAQPVATLDHDGGVLGVVLSDGSRHDRRAVFVVTRQHQQSDLAVRLGCALTEGGAIGTDEVGRTSLPGVWAVGTATKPALLAIGAAGHASTVAVALHAVL
jgi:thioredoxin reductase